MIKHKFSINWRYLLLAVLTVSSFIMMLMNDKIPQNLNYHSFADHRTYFGIQNFFDVISNLAFLMTGFWGLSITLKQKAEQNILPWICFFFGVLLVAPGSAYYHYAPNNETLVWDRLPMTIGFMGLFVAILAEYVHPSLEKLLFPFLGLGFSSVIAWAMTDDLRFYYWVQFFPLLIIPVILVMFQSRYKNKLYLVGALIFYLAAKISELNDHQLFMLLGQTLSGHTIKHILAAFAPVCIGFMLKKRKQQSNHKL